MHYYEISFHPERISKLKPFEKQYNFIHIKRTEFERNNSNISLTIFDEDKKKIYHSKKVATNKAHINFIHITFTEFETNNSNISLRISDEDNKRIYDSKSVPTDKAHIVKLKNNRYAAVKPLRNEFML